MSLVLAFLIARLQVPTQGPFINEIREYKRQDQLRQPAKGQIVFIGSSSFARWTKIQEAFPGHKVLNRAFGGSTLNDVAFWLQDVLFTYEPSQVVMYCGENDFASDSNLTVETLVDRFKGVYSSIRKKLPGAHFVYVSMKPSPSRWSLASKFREANRDIQATLQRDKLATFVDVWAGMLGPDGKPKPEIFVEDQLHLNDAGYKIWQPLINQALLKHSPRSGR